MRKAIIPLVATAAAQLLVIGSIAAAFAFQPEATQLPAVTIPVRADIEQGECIRQDPAPYEPMAYHVPLDADLQQYTAEMCDLYEVPLELAYAVMQVESGYASEKQRPRRKQSGFYDKKIKGRARIPAMGRKQDAGH